VQFTLLPAVSVVPAGSAEVAKAATDRVPTVKLAEVLGEINPNWYVIGRSGSVHRLAVKSKLTVISAPLSGNTRNVPGRGAPLVVTMTELCAIPQESVNVRLVLCGRASFAMIKLNGWGRVEGSRALARGVSTTLESAI
jgi:hypothetical protein